MKEFRKSAGNFLHEARAILALVALLQSSFGPLVQTARAAEKPAATTSRAAAGIPTATPIKHVIVIVGENRTFDHIFATYQPINGNTVNNLFSEGIINANGSPGPNYSKAVQYSADITGSPTFQLPQPAARLPTLSSRLP